MAYTIVKRAALGRSARIGALYDIRSDSFLRAESLFTSELDKKIISEPRSGMAMDGVIGASIGEKCKQLEVGAELQLSVLSGLVKLGGSGSYVGEERKSGRAQTLSFFYNQKTVYEEIVISQTKDEIDMDMLSSFQEGSTDATHFVVAIEWGALCTITCEHENNESENSTKVKGALNAGIDQLKSVINMKGSANASYDKRYYEQQQKFTCACRADGFASDRVLPVTFEDAVEFAKSIPKLGEGTNNDKGVPLTYYLMPLNRVVKMCKPETQFDKQAENIDESTVKRCTQIWQKISKRRQDVYDLHRDLHANEVYVLNESMKRIDDIYDKLALEESDFKRDLQQAVKRVRSGQDDISYLKRFVEQTSNSMSNSEYNKDIEAFQNHIDHLNMIKEWKSRGIRYIDRKGTLNTHSKPIVVVFYRIENSGTTCQEVDKNEEFFLRLQATHSNNEKFEFSVVEHHLREDLWPHGIQNPTIHKYQEGRLQYTDLYGAEGKDAEMCLIKIGATSEYQTHPIFEADVRLRCPNALYGSRSKCNEKFKYWRCSKCKTFVGYGINDYQFYCKCGTSNPKEAKFRCNDKQHSTNYVDYPADKLENELSNQQPRKEMNILILGETGVGKSTWINAFRNYFHFADFKEALQSKECHALIPSSFTTFAKSVKEKEGKRIEVGNQNDPDEVQEIGKSATKKTHSYRFDLGGFRIRLIDTPGIGDCEGPEQHRKNAQNILSQLTFHDDIHAICVLLKPNDSRLTVMLRFCIQEMLLPLHVSAKNNLLFCFTNTRGTFYAPGESLPTLIRELRDRKVEIEVTEDKYFCFDNEAFRLLACVKNGVVFNKEEEATYSTSWETSIRETGRLLKTASKLKPHKIRDTISMNEARRVILHMGKPLAQVAKEIEEIKKRAEKVMHDVDMVEDIMKGMERLQLNGYDYVFADIRHPRTVCTHQDCGDIISVGTAHTTVHRKICHDNCTCVNGISTQTRNDKRLYKCVVMQNGKCTVCGHPVTSHMHMTYDTKKVGRIFVDPKKLMREKIDMEAEVETISEEPRNDSVDAQISLTARKHRKTTGNIQMIKATVKQDVCAIRNELEEEEKVIMKTAAKYASFLEASALLLYNDAVEDYLQMSIDLEQSKPEETRNDALVKNMQQMKLNYENEKKILDEAMETGALENTRYQNEVMTMQKKLFKLKHFGPTLEKLFSKISITNSARHVNFNETPVDLSSFPSPSKMPKYKEKTGCFLS